MASSIRASSRSVTFGWPALIFLACTVLAEPAAGQISLVAGDSPVAMNGFEFAAGAVRGSAVAYDPVHGVYLVVGAYGSARGIFVNTDGVPVSASFLIAPQTEWAHFPRVVYSAGLANGAGGFGAFLMTWHDETPGQVGNFVLARVVSFPAGGPIGSTMVVSDVASFWEAGAPAAYSPASGVFLVVWQTCCGGGSFVRGQRLVIDGNGIPQLLGPAIPVSADKGRDPSVAYNPTTNEFGVSFSGWDAISATVSLAVITPAGAMPVRTLFHRAAGTYITDIAVNSTNGRYVLGWSEGQGTRAAEFNSAGTALGIGLVSSAVGAYDAVSLSFNPNSRTFLLLGHTASGEVGAAELSSRGARIGSETVGSNSGNLGAFYPRAASNGNRWLDSFSRKFDSVRVHAVVTATTNGGGDVPLPPTGAPPGSDPPQITTQPASQTIAAGTSAVLSVAVAGTAPFTYQWYAGDSPNQAQPIPGATSDTYITLALQTSKRYWVRVTNAFGSANSSTAFIAATHIANGGFWGNSMAGWSVFATPDQNYLQWGVDNEVLQFYRVPPPSGTNQATVFQQTGASFAANIGIRAFFQLGNTSSVRKRISVLLTDADFSDLAVCTFWLAPNTPLQTYAMLSHTTEAWSNASIYFYAASTGANGGTYLLDNVVFEQDMTLPTGRTDCYDPTAPAPALLPHSSNLVANPTFDSGTIPPWIAFGTLSHQVSGGVVEMLQPPGPAGSFLQLTGTPMAANDILSASFSLGNSSGVRKRVTVILHDSDFSDLSVCSFWLPAGAPLQTYAMTTFATRAWSNATLSFYVATQGFEPWVRLDNVFVQRAPTVATAGTECMAPGAVPFQLMSAAGASANANGSTPSKAARASAPAAGSAAGRAAAPTVAQPAADLLDAAHRTDWIETLDLRSSSTAVLSFESSLSMDSASSAEIQVSEDGTTWQTLVQVPASDDWITLNVDLSAWAGRVVQVRFAFDAKAPRRGGRPDTWLIGDVRVVR